VRALLRRPPLAPAAPPSPELRAGEIRIDPEAHRAWVGELPLELTVTELQILKLFVSRPGRVWTRDDLAARAYPDGPRHVSDRTLDSHVRNVRAALRARGIDPIETVHGLGWRLRS
jgi:two-component system OmpR family response regulator